MGRAERDRRNKRERTKKKGIGDAKVKEVRERENRWHGFFYSDPCVYNVIASPYITQHNTIP